MPQLKITIRGRDRPKTRTVKSKSSVVEEILQEIGINPLEFLVRLNGEFVPDTQKAKSGDRLELLEITSRG